MELDSVNQTARLTQERAQSAAELFQDFIRQDGGSTEILSEAPGHMATAAVTVPLGLLHMRSAP